MTDLAEFAREKGIKYFMISYTDLFGSQRAKLAPAQAIADMQENGAGFAGFATVLSQSFLALAISLSVAYIFFLPEAAQVRAR